MITDFKDIDLTKDYDVKMPKSPEYVGKQYGVEFLGGHTRIYSLGDDATEEEAAMRELAFKFFLECKYEVKVHNPRAKVTA